MAVLLLSANFSLIFAEPLNWRFHVGGMRSLLRYDPPGKNLANDQNFRRWSFMLGLELQMPIHHDWFFETGLNFRLGPTTYTYEDYYEKNKAIFIPLNDFNNKMSYIGDNKELVNPAISIEKSWFFDIPIRAGWKFHLNNDNEFQFSLGPYMCFNLTTPTAVGISGGGRKIEDINCFSLGISPSVVYKHRALSLGLYYQNPCIYNGQKNRETNVLMFTIGVNFYGRKIDMDKLASGLDVASSVLSGATSVMSSYYEGANGSTEIDYASGEKKLNSNKKENTGQKANYDRTARNRDYKTYFEYETTVIKIINGDDRTNSKTDIQNRMRKLRKKWDDRNDGWTKSPYEDK